MTTKVKPIPEGFHAVTPCLTLKNSLKAIEFYKKAFGAKKLDVFPSPDGKRIFFACSFSNCGSVSRPRAGESPPTTTS